MTKEYRDEILRINADQEASITVTTRLFSCHHFKVLSTASFMWCNACARENTEPELQESIGYMRGKPIAAVEFTIRGEGEVDVIRIM